MQSRRMSLLESLANIAIGYLIAVATQMLVFPIFGIKIPARDNFLIGLIFTAVSLIRSYCLRRIFTRLR